MKLRSRSIPLLARCRRPWAGWLQVATATMMIFSQLPMALASWSDTDSDSQNDTWTDPQTNMATSLVTMNLQGSDADGDGATNDEEAAEGSNPFLYDTDYDGLNDGDELHYVKPSLGVSLTNWDSDGDGVSDHDEWYGFSGVTYPGGQLPGYSNASYSDYDGDGIRNPWDPMPTDPSNYSNVNYTYWYGDAAGNMDGDGLPNWQDPFPSDSSNYSSANGVSWYGDVLGDADGDGQPNWQDSEPYGPPQPPSDSDSDGLPDSTDPFPYDAGNYSSINYISWYNNVLGDADSDGTANWQDSQPYGPDADWDGILDGNDPFPNDGNNYSSRNNTYWYADVLGDQDYDGVLNWQDPYPYDGSNYSSSNYNYWYGNVLGDADNDGTLNWEDSEPYGPPISDMDWDGVSDSTDPYPYDSTNYSSVNQTAWYGNVLGDSDADSLVNWQDPYPSDSSNYSTVNQTSWHGSVLGDNDGDGLQNWQDPAPSDYSNYSSNNGTYWYSNAAGDDDNDGFNNWRDPYPSDSSNYSSVNGGYWAGNIFNDDDGDTILNWRDPYPSDANNYSNYNFISWQTQVLGDADGDGTPNWQDSEPYGPPPPDSDGDGFPDSTDPFPYDSSNYSYYNSTYWYWSVFGDSDNDGVLNWQDYEPYGPPADSDGDGFNDSIDPFSADYTNYSSYNGISWYGSVLSDYDGDGILNWQDYEPYGPPMDSDADGIVDSNDPFPWDYNNYSYINSISWYGNVLGDADNDGTVNWQDMDPYGMPDADGDGIQDMEDPFPNDSSNYSSVNGQAWHGSVFNDNDGDGLVNWRDPFPNDSMNLSSVNGTYWYGDVLGDADSDGVQNWQDPYPYDSGNYSAVNNVSWYGDVLGDADSDGQPNWNDPEPYPVPPVDNDGDGLTAAQETGYGTSDNDVDCDDDGLTDYEELIVYQTNPLNAHGLSQAFGWGDLYTDYYLVDDTDSDNDGIPNRVEAFYGMMPYSAADAAGDLDGDGISNLAQYQAGLSLNSGVDLYDSDGDGMTNVFEDYYGLDKNNFNDAVADMDNDGVLNYEEALLLLSPLSSDTHATGGMGDLGVLMAAMLYPEGGEPTVDADSDGIPDWMEAALTGTNVRFARVTAGDFDGDGLPDVWEHQYGRWNYPTLGLLLRQADDAVDAEGDGLTNLEEYQTEKNPLISDQSSGPGGSGGLDSDGDGVSDADEAEQGTDPLDDDSDNDGVDDGQEQEDGTDPTNASSHANDPQVRIPFEVTYTNWKGGAVGASPPGWYQDESIYVENLTGTKQRYRYVQYDTHSPPGEDTDGAPETVTFTSSSEAYAWAAANTEPKPPYYITYHSVDAYYDSEGVFVGANHIKVRTTSDGSQPDTTTTEAIDQSAAETLMMNPLPPDYELGDSDWTIASVSSDGNGYTIPGEWNRNEASYSYVRPMNLGNPAEWLNASAQSTQTSSSDLSHNIPGLPGGDLQFETTKLRRAGALAAFSMGWFNTDTVEITGGPENTTESFTSSSGSYMHGTAKIRWDASWPAQMDNDEREAWMSRYVVVERETSYPSEGEPIVNILSAKSLKDAINQNFDVDVGNPQGYEGGSKARELLILPIELRDTKDPANAGDDVPIMNWDPTQDIKKSNIAWIEAHSSATDPAPRMPQLELRVPGLPQGMTIEAKLEVQYDRGNGLRKARNQTEDRVRIPADGNYQTVSGDAWQIWQAYAGQPFFGGEATLTYRLMNGQSQAVAPKTIRFRIGGKNPLSAKARTFIESLNNAGAQGPLWFAYAIARSESRDYNGQGTRYNQFLQLPRHRRDASRPLWGNDGGTTPGGYGMFQVTGNAADARANIPRQQIWNWQENARAGVAILEAKRNAADTWMTRQKNGSNANGVALPNLTVVSVTFAEATNRTMNHAVTMKAWNGASKAPAGLVDSEGGAPGFIIDPQGGGHFCYWKNSAGGWALSRYNNPPGNIQSFNYVRRVCSEVQ